MPMIYVATEVSTGDGRNGHVETADGKVSLDLAYPKEIGGSGTGSNPEQLVAMGYAACFSSALGAVARRRHITLRHRALRQLHIASFRATHISALVRSGHLS